MALFIGRYWLQFDRVYLSTPEKVAIVDHALKKTYIVKKTGLPDAGKNVSTTNLVQFTCFGSL